jgi:hypothetical protein
MIGHRAIMLGFDPGGEKRFGWCVAQATNKGHLQLRDSGSANHAAGAVMAALSKTGTVGRVEAAGIDSPLFWIADGDRKVDKSIRSAMRRLGAPHVDGTVQRVNSLRGACLIQGVMTAHLLRRELPEIRITESHPKALLWLLRVARIELRVVDVGMSHIIDLIESESQHLPDHERDAALGAVAALAMIDQRSGWRDLYREEKNAFTPVSPVEYWMPVDVAT